jgi:hypothetical protein
MDAAIETTFCIKGGLNFPKIAKKMENNRASTIIPIVGGHFIHR